MDFTLFPTHPIIIIIIIIIIRLVLNPTPQHSPGKGFYTSGSVGSVISKNELSSSGTTSGGDLRHDLLRPSGTTSGGGAGANNNQARISGGEGGSVAPQNLLTYF
jgi:hypothetical protein